MAEGGGEEDSRRTEAGRPEGGITLNRIAGRLVEAGWGVRFERKSGGAVGFVAAAPGSDLDGPGAVGGALYSEGRLVEDPSLAGHVLVLASLWTRGLAGVSVEAAVADGGFADGASGQDGGNGAPGGNEEEGALGSINAWNRDSVFGCGSVEEDGAIRLRHAAGFSKDDDVMLDATLELWTHLTESFAGAGFEPAALAAAKAESWNPAGVGSGADSSPNADSAFFAAAEPIEREFPGHSGRAQRAAGETFRRLLAGLRAWFL